MRGNVLDLAVGVIIGAAFQAIVTSLTSDIISPILGIFGGVNFDQFQVTINGATIMYGKFITEVILRVEDSAILFSTNSSEHPQNAKRTKNTT